MLPTQKQIAAAGCPVLALFEQIRQEAPLQVNSQQAVAYASDCTGWGSCSQSFHHLHVASEPQFMCELNAKLRQMLATSFAPLRMHTDVWSASRGKESLAQPVVVYEAGFPCQPFAPQGKHQGLDDERGRGQVIHAIWTTCPGQTQQSSCWKTFKHWCKPSTVTRSKRSCTPCARSV